MKLIDTHAHLDFPRFKRDRQKVIARAWDNGLCYIVNVGADLESSQRSIALAEEYPFIYATVGIHPHDAKELTEPLLNKLRIMAQNDQVKAIGEIGLDYHYDNSPCDIQKKAFRQQLHLAKELELSLVIHSRDADQDTFDIITEMAEEIDFAKQGAIMHCFGSGVKMARKYLDLGFYLSFGGITTFKNASKVRDVVREIPLDRILLETDCPYLAPEPKRGKRNEPTYIHFVAEKIAQIKDINIREVAETTTDNAIKVYGLPGIL